MIVRERHWHALTFPWWVVRSADAKSERLLFKLPELTQLQAEVLEMLQLLRHPPSDLKEFSR